VRRLVLLGAIVVLITAACRSDGDTTATDTGSDGPSNLAAEVASYELLAAIPNRFLVGLFVADEGVVSYGSVDMAFSYLGDGSASPTSGPDATGGFILVPPESGHSHEGENPDEHMGMEPSPSPALDADLDAAAAKAPEVTQPDQVRGVYQASDVIFEEAGVWQVDVSVDLAGQRETASANFNVVAEPSYPAPGQAAPASDNSVMETPGAKPSEVDSRATEGWPSVPDPELHQVNIKDALKEGRPIVVVVSTPLYCQSRFCGPITDQIAHISAGYDDVADFVHLEVWKNYQKKSVNQEAADWVYRSDEITEPWVFLVGADGKIIDRWANVLDHRELEQELDALRA
jgi:hypothetical protein